MFSASSATAPSPSRAVRLAVAAAATLVAAAFVILRNRFLRGWPGDADLAVVGARAFRAGRNPFTTVGPHRAIPWPFPFYYPFTTVLLAAPFTTLPPIDFRLLVVAGGTGLLAWALTKERSLNVVVPALASGAMFGAWQAGQRTPLLTAAALLPGLGWLFAAKPNFGLAVGTYRAHFAPYLLALAFVIAATLAWPGWIAAWRATLAESPHFAEPALLFPFGPAMLLALLRWRRPEARLLVTCALVPQSTLVYETLPLVCLVPATPREARVLSAGSLLALGVQLFIAQHATPFPVLTRDTGLAELPLVYLPCLVMVLSRPNQGELPTWLAWIERRWVARRPMARD